MNNDKLYTLEIKKSHIVWVISISIAVFLISLASWLVATESNIHKAQNQKIEELQKQLTECQAEATAWYNATTSLSDQIAFAALKGLPAEKVNTDISTAFAVKGHELNCIQPKLPTG